MGEDMCSGELRSDLMLRLREGRCGEDEEQVCEGKEHPPLHILETAIGCYIIILTPKCKICHINTELTETN